MDLNVDIVEYLEHKTILITGSTGFLAKIFIEKVLRVQPNVKQLFLLFRAPDELLAAHRLRTEVVEKELFRVLRTKYSVGFDSFILEKVTPVVGNVALENFGIEDLNVCKKILNEVEVIINFAANTNFDARYDEALEANTLGARTALNFAKKCARLEMLLHTSTAYVCGEKSGVILENPLSMGETLNGTCQVLDIEQELKLVKELLNRLKAQNVSKKEEDKAIKQLGLQRARLFGWPNTYVFTKAMGEMLIGEMREQVPVVITRPTIISSTYREPFPGWTEGIRTCDGFLVAFAKGKLPCFLGNLDTVFDLVPGDMVVNAILFIMVAHAQHSPDFPFVYQICSTSTAKSLNSVKLREYAYGYFSNNPLRAQDGKSLIKVSKPLRLPTMASFRTYMFVNYMLPLKGLKMVNTLCCQYFHKTLEDGNRKINRTIRLVELNEPYVFFKGTFDDLNLRNLRMSMRTNEVDGDTFYFDPKIINWEDYFMNVHLPGLVKYVIK